jgi:hypothetical protein
VFRASLQERLKAIFGFDKVTFDQVSDSREQESLFIQVDRAVTRVKDGRQTARVAGTLRIFAQQDKLPYGFFSKQIQEADPEDLEGLFFHDFEENKGVFQNVAERSLGFAFFFDSQFDPAIGTLTSIDLSYPES